MVIMRTHGSVYTWCGCREKATGRRLGSRCPRRGQAGHGSWYLSLELPAAADGSLRRVRRGGYLSTKGLCSSPGDFASRLAGCGQPGLRSPTGC